MWLKTTSLSSLMIGIIEHWEGLCPQNYCSKVTANLNITLKALFPHKKRPQRTSQSQHPWKSCNCSSLITNAKIPKRWGHNHKTWRVGAPRWTLKSALIRQITWHEYYQNTVESFGGGRVRSKIPSVNISEATGRRSERQHSTVDYSNVFVSKAFGLEAVLKGNGGKIP